MSWVAVGVAAVGLVTSVAGSAIGGCGGDGGGGAGDVTTTQSVEFPEETRALFQNIEEPLLRGSQQELSALLMPLLGGFRTRDAANQQLGTARTQSMALTAAKHSGQQSGLTDFGPLMESTQGLQPELLAALQQLALQRGQQSNAVVPPGYGQFLSPQTQTQQSGGGGGDSFGTGFQIAQGLASVAGAYFGGSAKTGAGAFAASNL